MDKSSQNYLEVAYNVDEGVLITTAKTMGGTAQDVIEVRARMAEEVMTHAVVYELRRKGYVVIPPE